VDPGDLDAGLVAAGLCTCVGGVRIGACGVGGLQRGQGVVPGLADRRGGCPGVLGCLSRAGKGDGGLGLGLAAGGVRGGQRRSDPAGVGGGQLGGSTGYQAGGIGEQLVQGG
jgi:hypothetical protein